MKGNFHNILTIAKAKYKGELCANGAREKENHTKHSEMHMSDWIIRTRGDQDNFLRGRHDLDIGIEYNRDVDGAEGTS